jgi:hypothetical protein
MLILRKMRFVEHLREKINTYKVLIRKPEGKRPNGGSRYR